MGDSRIRVPVAQLRTVAGQWRGLAAELTGSSPSAGPRFQPSTVAVNSLHAAVDLAATTFTARTHATANHTEAAAMAYASDEAAAAVAMTLVSRAVAQ